MKTNKEMIFSLNITIKIQYVLIELGSKISNILQKSISIIFFDLQHVLHIGKHLQHNMEKIFNWLNHKIYSNMIQFWSSQKIYKKIKC